MKKFKKRRRKLHTRKIFLLNSILVVFLFLGIGYSLLSTELTIDGSTKVTEYVEPTLYNVLYKEAKKNGLAKEYTGSHQDSMNASLSTEKIYHWYAKNSTEGTAILDKNNVIFADHCWQMIRTTDTGGVKMIYNGEAVDNKCLSSRENQVGYASFDSQNLASNYWYGTDYTYDTTNQEFSLSGTTEQATWNVTNAPSLIGKYTCKQTTESATCSTIYYIESYNDTSSANVLSLNSNSHYSQFGRLPFNANSNSIAYFGYMYGDVYPYSTFNEKYNQTLSVSQKILSSTPLNTSYWFADSIDYGNLATNKYSLVNPYQVSSSSDYPNLVGKYTFRSSNKNDTGTSVYYIAGVSGSTMYYKQLQNGNLLSAYEPIIFGDAITDNGNGTYTINNPISVFLTAWFANSADYKNKYTCNNSSTTCTAPRYITGTSWLDYGYLDVGEKIMIGKTRSGTSLTDTLLVRKDEFILNASDYSDYKYTCNTDSATCTETTLRMIDSFTTSGYNYAPNHYFGSSVTWDGTNYTLVNPIEIENYNNLTNLSTHHYMCESYGLKTCQTVAYIYYTSSGTRYYITLSNGVPSINKAIEDMLTKNTTNSIIKSGVDAWYKHYMLDYDDNIEDTIFCNDRSSTSLDGWDPNGGNITEFLKFNGFIGLFRDLSCRNITDQFSISNNSAKLNYKVGLASNSEIILLNNKNAQITGQSYWVATASTLNYNLPHLLYVSGNDGLNYFGSNTVNYYGVRPAISLKPGTQYSTGDGSMANPYIVATE